MKNKLTDWLEKVSNIDPNYGVTHVLLTLMILGIAILINNHVVTIVGIGAIVYWIYRELQGPDQHLPWYKRLVAYPDRFLDWFFPTLTVVLVLVAINVK